MLQSLLQFLHLCFRSKIRLTSSVPERAFSIVVIWAQQPGWAESFVLLGQALTSKVHNRRVFNSLGFIRTDFQTHLLCPGHPNLLDPPGYEGDKSPNWKAGWHSLSSQQLSQPIPTSRGGNDNRLQCSCLENRRDRGAWRAAVCGVAQSQTRLKRLSSSSSSRIPSSFHAKAFFLKFRMSDWTAHHCPPAPRSCPLPQYLCTSSQSPSHPNSHHFPSLNNSIP